MRGQFKYVKGLHRVRCVVDFSLVGDFSFLKVLPHQYGSWTFQSVVSEAVKFCL